MKRIGILVLKICTFCVIVLPLSGKAEMSEMTIDEMQEQAIDIGTYQQTTDQATENDTEIDDELIDTEADKLEKYLHEKTISETLAVERERDVSQLEEWEHIAPTGDIAKGSGRTSSYEAPEINVGKHYTPPPNPLNPNAP